MVLAVVDALIGLPYSSTGALVSALLAAAVLPLRRRLPWVCAVVVAVGLFWGYALLAAMVVVFSLAVVTGARPTHRCRRGAQRVRREPRGDGTAAGPRRLGQRRPLRVDLRDRPWALGELVVTRRELSRRLAEIDERAAREALERERAVLAREMHDVVSHQVSLIAVQAGALQVTSTDDPTRSAARTIRELSVRTLDELRSMVEVLRTAGGSVREDAPSPGVRDLDGLTAGCGLAVRSSLQVPDDLPAPVQRAVFRAVQEGLTNVRKHAPGAQVAVVVAHDGERTRVEVRNGPRPNPPRRCPAPGTGCSVCASGRPCSTGRSTPPDAGRGFALVVTIPTPDRDS